MTLEITAKHDPISEALIIEGLRTNNRRYTPDDIVPLCAFDHAGNGELIGGLIARTYWNYLDIRYLWVSEEYRKQGKATTMLNAVEAEAIERGCSRAFLDTYSFQALGFYQKLGYEEFGRLADFAGGHSRHYLHKVLI